ncbi:hypothetical protein PI124_g23234 [Phytophthora idaei]|nr:hypothetical protein PI125_g25290 [Phytophthora idaei]KAG3124473.1 hypothetical protein PI126_g23241 [Phytophthora idaei]KAG3231671.1 hypothetical protein PI124_g23234 [Phytophthora idaei]
MRTLQEDPLYVRGWKISDEFDVEVDGVEHPRHRIPGIIVGFSPGGVYKWRVDYSDDDIMYYECEALVDLILEACNRGLDVARSAAAKHSIVEDSSNSMDSSSDSYSKDFYSDSDVEEDDMFGGTSSSLLELLKAEHSG